MNDFETLKQLEAQSVMHTYNRFDLGLDHGKGAVLFDFDGNAYLDLTSGIGVNSLGYAHPALVQAISEQAGKLMEISNLYYTKPMVYAADRLTKSTGMKRVFFANSGAEANEGAIKCARKYAADTHGPERYKILSLKNSFHGRTIATLEATGQDHFHTDFFPFTNGFDYVEANNIEDLQAKATDEVAAIMVELIQGESGVRPLQPEFVKAIEDVCAQKDILFIVDEVQTGIGRTGSLFCFQNYGIHPDIVTMAKGLGGGVPIGGFMTNEKTEHVLGPGDHGSTFGANPLVCTAANTVLSIVDTPEFLADVRQKGELLQQEIKKIQSPDILDVRGQGLMVGIQVPAEKIGSYIQKLMDEGLLVLKAGSDTIRLLPPLVITTDQILEAVDIMKEVFEA